MATPAEGASILIVKQPWVDLILSGHKQMEIRRQACRFPIGKPVYLAQSGTKTIVGVVTFDGCVGPLTPAEFDAYRDAHRVDINPYPTAHGWKFHSPVRFDTPIPYLHPRGAQTWVKYTLGS